MFQPKAKRRGLINLDPDEEVESARPWPIRATKRGRPYTGEDNRDPVTAIRLSEQLRAEIDAWAASQPEALSRSEAIRLLVQMALNAAKQKARR